MSVNDAINQAGGFRGFAKTSGVYVIKANGITEKLEEIFLLKILI